MGDERNVTTEAIQAIQIDPDGRYILLLHLADHVPEPELMAMISRTKGILHEWWYSDEPFLVLAIDKVLTATLQRVDGDITLDKAT